MPVPSHYSTAAVEAPRRFAYWTDVVCQPCLKADAESVAVVGDIVGHAEPEVRTGAWLLATQSVAS